MASCPETAQPPPSGAHPSPAAVYARLNPARRLSLAQKADAFLDLLEIEPGAPTVQTSRRAQIQRDIRTHGFYEHSPEELLWGCRYAWRHSVRCIGRFFWKQLEVRDRRGLHSLEDVAAECCAHLEAATNAGAVRPLVTVFSPARPRAKKNLRIWNYQLLRYAGYRSADGSILGDPAESAFTDECIRLGWRPPAEPGMFDLLPLLLSGPGQKPRLFEIPRNLVLEVPLSHPEWDWFEQLGLRWYAVPIVSNMLLEIGGIHYTAAPFNGWYMGTEIGARNLADISRYDMLPEIAKRLGIFSNRESSLWRDRALVELNRAVLHSYQAARVRIADHHTAAQSHVRFEEEERAAGRPVTGRWDWLVPPLSGATSAVWNRSYDPTEYSPNFRYQQAPSL
jgi:nitric-oxide synthase